MPASVNPPFAVPKGDGPTGTGLFLDGVEIVNAPAAIPSGSDTHLDGVDVGASPASVPTGSTSTRFLGLRSFHITAVGTLADPDAIPDPIPGDTWTLTFRAVAVDYQLDEDDTAADACAALAALVNTAFPGVMSAVASTSFLLTTVLEQSDHTKPVLTTDGTGTHVDADLGQVSYSPATAPAGSGPTAGDGETDGAPNGYTPLPTPGGPTV